MLAQVFRLSADMWRELAKLDEGRGSQPLLDMAYQLDHAASEIMETGMLLDIPRLCELEKVDFHSQKPSANNLPCYSGDQSADLC